ncbi:hypothetical protein A9Z61_00105 [Moraxella osloensis]|nr:hypothetical protein [Moraxella osloensis]OBX57833.1 hypothetical protein A9Z61_00105 [Moraxella osloensis]BAV11145.1 hypothetical protein MOSL_0572 [Moraxella osloensis]
MSATTKNIIARQWLIIDYLLQTSNYVSTIQIQNFLANKGMDAEMRTIQRDLKLLQEVIPLECRTDDKPYSWRWKRLEKTQKHQLSLTQAVAFRLIETELKDHIPTDLMNQLEPILMKARFVLAMANVPDMVYEDIDSRFGNGLPNGFVQLNPVNQVINEVRRLFKNISLPDSFFSKGALRLDASERKVLKQLKVELDKVDVPELVKEITILAD